MHALASKRIDERAPQLNAGEYAPPGPSSRIEQTRGALIIRGVIPPSVEEAAMASGTTKGRQIGGDDEGEHP